MVEKNVNPLPTSSRKAAKGALTIAIALLQDERVRAQVNRAPAAARDWAAQRRQTNAMRLGAGNRLDPTQRFGQKGIRRRLAALERNVSLVFPDSTGADATAIYQAIDELERAVAVSDTMPMAERRRSRGRISTELGRLELALVDAVLPAVTEPTTRGDA